MALMTGACGWLAAVDPQTLQKLVVFHMVLPILSSHQKSLPTVKM
jgi:hypothetical protein